MELPASQSQATLHLQPVRQLKVPDQIPLTWSCPIHQPDHQATYAMETRHQAFIHEFFNLGSLNIYGYPKAPALAPKKNRVIAIIKLVGLIASAGKMNRNAARITASTARHQTCLPYDLPMAWPALNHSGT